MSDASRQSLIEQLKMLFTDQITTSISDREHHGRDPGHDVPMPPDAVIYPRSTEQVCEIVKLCAQYKVPMIPYGVGSSLEQHVVAPQGGISLDFSKMDEILQVNPEDMDMRVQAGVTREQLNSHIRDTGLFFPIDPGANATLGGMASTRASGTNAVRYGTMKTNVIGLTVVTPQGKIIKTGGRARKSAAGYDLTAVYIGSEGTLGIITEVAVKLSPIPEKIAAAVVSFDSLEDAVTTVIETLQCAVPIARVELLDQVQMKAIKQHSDLDYPELPTLFLEFHGGLASVEEQIKTVEDIAQGNSGKDFSWAEQPEDRTKLWAARHEAYYANRGLVPGANMLTTDVCVPISKLPECLLETRADLDEAGVISPIIGHVGDGNFHVMMLYTDEQKTMIDQANERLVARALKFEGTCTGEHGIGIGKRQFLLDEHGESVEEMRKIKTIFDPDNLMNPGKIFF
ncbi:MAG: FAD-binding protein [Kangiellaceae bacterium]|nr:FAD-binding protein [Kangiellaceae bacterium]